MGYMNIHLPPNKGLSDLEDIYPLLQQEFRATAVKTGEVNGKFVQIIFGLVELKNIGWSRELLHMGTLKVELPSAFGKLFIDFEDGASCHMLNGGVTRMGKTVLLTYLATNIFLQNEGNVRIFLSSAKIKDFYPFDLIPSVMMAEDYTGMHTMLDIIIAEYETRKKMLRIPELRKAKDAKDVRTKYPEYFIHFCPVFLFIDEYARFADDPEIQRKVTEIVETAGYVNIHVVIASQRPDAQSVLKPRIRANLLCRLSFSTADKKNSEIILDREGAETLGRIAGRGMVVDSDMSVIQVPFLDTDTCDDLLRPYQIELKESKDDEQVDEGRNDNESTSEVQSLFEESDSLSDLQGKHKSSKRGKSSAKKTIIVWGDFPDTKREG